MSRSWKMPRKILCATDLSPGCDRAIDRAIQLAAEWKALLLLVHVVDDTGLQTKDFAALTRQAEAELKRQTSDHPAASEIEIEVIVSQGNPAERILAKCDRLFVDLLVMGTGDKSSLRQRLLGSTIDHVLRNALQPVLSVHDRAHVAYRTIAATTDFSAPSKEALDCALALFPNAETTVVHAYEDTLHGLFPSDRVTGDLADRHKIEMRAFAEKSMSEFVGDARVSCPSLQTAIEIGTPELGLQTYIERQNPDLIVVGTTGEPGFAGP